MPEYFIANFSGFFGIVWDGGFVYSKQFSSSLIETKLEAILFCSELKDIAGYYDTEEPFRSNKNLYLPRGIC